MNLTNEADSLLSGSQGRKSLIPRSAGQSAVRTTLQAGSHSQVLGLQLA